MPSPITTVIVTPPGLATRCVSSDALPVTVTVVLWPDASVPDAGETVTSPRTLDGSVIVQRTGPWLAVSVITLPDSGARVIVVGDTISVPGPAGGEVEPEGPGLPGEADGVGETRWVGEAGIPGVADGPAVRVAAGNALCGAEPPCVPGSWPPPPFPPITPGAAFADGAAVLGAPPSTAMATTAATTVAAPVPAAACAARERHGDAGGSSGFGKP
jgi:hypothetical protein